MPAVAMGAFLIGLMVAALLIPSHGGAGSAGGAVGTAGTTTGSSGLAAGTGCSATDSGAGGCATGSTGGVDTGTAMAAGGATPGGGAGGAVVGGTAVGGTATGPAGSVANGGAAVTGSGPAGGSTLAPPGGNGGATAAGVTGTSITVGVQAGDSTALQPACPRCGEGGLATDRALMAGLIALWHKEGKLPVYGRDLSPIFQVANDADATGASSQAACENLVAQHPFVALTGAGAGGTQCLTQQNHVLTVDGLGGNLLASMKQYAPYLWELGPDLEDVGTAFATWAGSVGLLKGQVLGLYAPNDATTSGVQEYLNATFVAQLHKLGYQLKVNYQYNQQGQSDDAVAVQKMRAAGVTTMFVVGSLTEPSGFQNAAEQLGYRPKYPVADAGTYAFTDSLADVEYNSNAENNNYALGTRWWSWSARNPATPAGNPAAAECLTAYETQTHTNLDVYNDDAKIRYILDECADMQVILAAIRNAGPTLTQASFVKGIESIQNLQTAEYNSVTFGPGRYTGSNEWQSTLFKKSRWQPSNDYWGAVGDWRPWSDFPQDSATVAQAVAEGQ